MKRADEEPTPEAIEDALAQDPLHRKREIEDFLKMLIAVEPPYTFVIDAPWGSGKTFFVKQVARVLQMANLTLDPDLETLNATLGETATEPPPRDAMSAHLFQRVGRRPFRQSDLAHIGLYR